MPQSRYRRRRQIGRLTPPARNGHCRRRYREPNGPNSTPEGMIDQPGSSWPHRSSRDPGAGASPHALHRTLRERPSPTVQRVGASATPARSLAALPDDQLPLAAPLFVAVLASNRSAASSTMEGDRKSTRLNSSHLVISYAVFCLKKKKKTLHCQHSHAHHQVCTPHHDK